MRLDKLIYDIREGVRAYTDDSEIDDRYIIFLYDTEREFFIRQELNNFQRNNDTLISQTLCLELIEVSDDECESGDCTTIMRTKKPIPKPIDLHTKPAIFKVKPTKKLAVPFYFISKEKATYYTDAPFKGVYAFLDNDYHIYVVGTSEAVKLLECISVTGVFSSPLDLVEYKKCCKCPDSQINVCFDPLEEDYPVPGHLIKVIRKEVINSILVKLGIPADNINNSDDDQARIQQN